MELEDTTPFALELDALLQSTAFKRQLVLWYHFKKDMDPIDISEETDIPLQTVRDHINRWNSTGSIEDRKGKGRKTSLSKKDQGKIVKMQLEDRKRTASSIHRELLDDGSAISYFQTLHVIQGTFESVYAPYKIKITDTNKQKRIKWAIEHSKWRSWKFANVIWTDEKVFGLHPQGRKLKVKILPGESPEDFS